MRIPSELNQLIDESLCHMANLQKRHPGIFAEFSVPILWFGDYRRYRASENKILSLAINPSSAEFEEDDRKNSPSIFRFPLAKNCVGKRTLTERQRISLVSSWNCYFETEPYSWFDMFKPVFEEFNASFYAKDDAQYRVLHVDLATPMATRIKWSGKDNPKREIIQDSLQRKLFEKTMSFLQPDLVFASCGRRLFEQFIPRQRWQNERVLIRFPYGTTGKTSNLHSFVLQLHSGQRVRMVLFEPSYHGVLGGINTNQKKQIGKCLQSILRNQK